MPPVIPVADRMMTAVHEAAHAVVAWSFGWEVASAELDGSGWSHDGGGLTRWGSGSFERKREDAAVIFLAGQVAEQHYLDEMGVGNHVKGRDIEHGGRSDTAMLRELMRDMGADAGSESGWRSQTERVVAREWPKIVRVAEELEQRRKLRGRATQG